MIEKWEALERLRRLKEQHRIETDRYREERKECLREVARAVAECSDQEKSRGTG